MIDVKPEFNTYDNLCASTFHGDGPSRWGRWTTETGRASSSGGSILSLHQWIKWRGVPLNEGQQFAGHAWWENMLPLILTVLRLYIHVGKNTQPYKNIQYMSVCVMQERWLLRSSDSVLMVRKSGCPLSHILNNASRLLILENSKAAALKERREWMEEDQARVFELFLTEFFTYKQKILIPLNYLDTVGIVTFLLHIYIHICAYY